MQFYDPYFISDTKVHRRVLLPPCLLISPVRPFITRFCKGLISPTEIFLEEEATEVVAGQGKMEYQILLKNVFNHPDVEISKTFRRQENFGRQIDSMEITIPVFFCPDMLCLQMRMKILEQTHLMNKLVSLFHE